MLVDVKRWRFKVFKMGVPERKEMKRHRRHNLKERFEILKTLGQGTYGKVKLSVEKVSGVQV